MRLNQILDSLSELAGLLNADRKCSWINDLQSLAYLVEDTLITTVPAAKIKSKRETLFGYSERREFENLYKYGNIDFYINFSDVHTLEFEVIQYRVRSMGGRIPLFSERNFNITGGIVIKGDSTATIGDEATKMIVDERMKLIRDKLVEIVSNPDDLIDKMHYLHVDVRTSSDPYRSESEISESVSVCNRKVVYIGRDVYKIMRTNN